MGRKKKAEKEKHIQKVFYLSEKSDSRLIAWLATKDNQSLYIRTLIYADIDKETKEPKSPGKSK